MDKFILLLANVLNVESSRLTDDMELKKLITWDSLSQVVFLAMADTEYGKTLVVDDIVNAETIKDLYELVRN
jgi:acyl carrier protein